MAFPDLPGGIRTILGEQERASVSEDAIRQAGALVKNSNYQVIIKREASRGLRGFTIKANLPESFSFGVSANYENTLPSSLTEAASQAPVPLIGEVISVINKFFKINAITQELTHQTWSSSSPISFSIPLLFDAVSSAEEDVIAPIRDLMALALPYRANGSDFTLLAPGPSLADPNHGKVSLRIGNMNFFPSVLIRDVSANFSSRFTQSGAPIAAECDVSFETVNTPVQDDMDIFFMRNGAEGRNPEEYGTLLGRGDRITNEVARAADNAKKNWLGNVANVIVPGGGGIVNSVKSILGSSPDLLGDFF